MPQEPGLRRRSLCTARRNTEPFCHLQEGETPLGIIPPTALRPLKQRFESIRPSLSTGVPASSPSVHLDALRGFAALSVLLNHWRGAFFADYSSLAHQNPLMAAAYVASGLGHQWVIVFFVMSGYLVGGSVIRSVTEGRWSWSSYLLARLTRLYVVLLPALLLGGAL